MRVSWRQLRPERVGFELDPGHERDGDNAAKVHRSRQDRIHKAHAEPLADHSVLAPGRYSTSTVGHSGARFLRIRFGDKIVTLSPIPFSIDATDPPAFDANGLRSYKPASIRESWTLVPITGSTIATSTARVKQEDQNAVLSDRGIPYC
jgi:hypothetical protein